MLKDEKLREKKGRVTRRWCKRLEEKFEDRGFMAQEELWNIACWKTEDHCVRKNVTLS